MKEEKNLQEYWYIARKKDYCIIAQNNCVISRKTIVERENSIFISELVQAGNFKLAKC